jgi:hypothetical protein
MAVPSVKLWPWQTKKKGGMTAFSPHRPPPIWVAGDQPGRTMLQLLGMLACSGLIWRITLKP